jgi:hypothetical protein
MIEFNLKAKQSYEDKKKYEKEEMKVYMDDIFTYLSKQHTFHNTVTLPNTYTVIIDDEL